MSWLGIAPFKKFPAPFRASIPACLRWQPRLTQITVKPMWPFFAAGLIIAYGANSAQNAMMASDEWKNDPRNPNAKSGGH
ncbi:ATP synthase subunit J-like protein [Hapsidospora chrysogenum ATCC 11550]|uniref:ATP synthase subunit J-like protein n=1 Tax=Hapsidospora chrysogenum (strain ATCC 11550 / CBS 779.69 / DSM 880 / IAM 14645 / JCM 23072 / IMI 49137) TaxID=857340 RepID=A0A086SYM3_HAPC1|nr:ATP synthase subunit J-like protein [Hapsidospora chrysogenum ATCC 11550]